MDYDDGGPAFPPGESGPMGMSLRDWFAGQALAALGRLNGMMQSLVLGDPRQSVRVGPDAQENRP